MCSWPSGGHPKYQTMLFSDTSLKNEKLFQYHLFLKPFTEYAWLCSLNAFADGRCKRKWLRAKTVLGLLIYRQRFKIKFNVDSLLKMAIFFFFCECCYVDWWTSAMKLKLNWLCLKGYKGMHMEYIEFTVGAPYSTKKQMRFHRHPVIGTRMYFKIEKVSQKSVHNYMNVLCPWGNSRRRWGVSFSFKIVSDFS